MDEFIKYSSFPNNTKFLGFVINLPENDEYLAVVKKSKLGNLYGWSNTPENAKLFSTYVDAEKFLDEYQKTGIVCLLFDLGKQLSVLTYYDYLDILKTSF